MIKVIDLDKQDQTLYTLAKVQEGLSDTFVYMLIVYDNTVIYPTDTVTFSGDNYHTVDTFSISNSSKGTYSMYMLALDEVNTPA